jgi:serine/threonine protein kinase
MAEILDNRYVLREEHQSGGMASIYKARRLDNDEFVAIKRFDKDKHLPKIEAEANCRELEALEKLRHPNIVRIIEHGEDANRREGWETCGRFGCGVGKPAHSAKKTAELDTPRPPHARRSLHHPRSAFDPRVNAIFSQLMARKPVTRSD